MMNCVLSSRTKTLAVRHLALLAPLQCFVKYASGACRWQFWGSLRLRHRRQFRERVVVICAAPTLLERSAKSLLRKTEVLIQSARRR